MRKSKFPAFAVYLAFIFLAIPDFAIIDIFPDCVAYAILLALIGQAKNVVPHLSEAYDGLKKLLLIAVIKIPAMLFMLSNMILGRDIIALMTFTFSAVEMMILVPTVKSAFQGMYYIGERSDAVEFLKPIKLIGNTLPCEKIEELCYLFFAVKLGLNTVSQLFILSSSSEIVTLRLRRIYPIMTAVSIFTTLIFGTVMLIIAFKYFNAIRRGGAAREAIQSLMTPEQERSIAKENKLSSLLKPLDLFVISQIFTLDITLKNVGEYNLLPRFIFPILIFIVAYKLFDKKHQLLNLAGCGAYALVSAIEFFVSFNFYNRYSSVDLVDSAAAQSAYRTVITVNVVELVFIIPMLLLFFIGARKFIIANTATHPCESGYGTLDKEMHRTLSLYVGAILGIDFIIALLKCLNVLLEASVSPLFTDAMDTLVAVSSAPWLYALISGISIILTFLAYYFVSQIKDEVKLKLNSQI